MEVLRALSLLAAACGLACQLLGFRGPVIWKDAALVCWTASCALVQASLL